MASASGVGRRRVTLVGFMAAGKSRIGRLLADRLGLPFVDTDAAIEAEFAMPVTGIFAAHGEDAFRAAERATIARLLDGPPNVIAVGGGAFLDPTSRERLNAVTTTVWIDPPFELVLARIRNSSKRPLAAGRSDADLRELWQQRRDCYALAHLHIATGDAPAEQTAADILARLP